MLEEDIVTCHMRKMSHKGIYEDQRANEQEQQFDFNRSESNGRIPGDIRGKHSCIQTYTHKHRIKKNNINVKI